MTNTNPNNNNNNLTPVASSGNITAKVLICSPSSIEIRKFTVHDKCFEQVIRMAKESVLADTDMVDISYQKGLEWVPIVSEDRWEEAKKALWQASQKQSHRAQMIIKAIFTTFEEMNGSSCGRQRSSSLCLDNILDFRNRLNSYISESQCIRKHNSIPIKKRRRTRVIDEDWMSTAKFVNT